MKPEEKIKKLKKRLIKAEVENKLMRAVIIQLGVPPVVLDKALDQNTKDLDTTAEVFTEKDKYR